jgi:hypothetical protein
MTSCRLPLAATAAPPIPSDFDREVAHYREMGAAYNAHPYGRTAPGHLDYQAILDDNNRASRELLRQFAAVMKMPALDLAAIAVKLHLVLLEYEGFELPEQAIRDISADARRLAQESRI